MGKRFVLFTESSTAKVESWWSEERDRQMSVPLVTKVTVM
jgi:hypothetical protein